MGKFKAVGAMLMATLYPENIPGELKKGFQWTMWKKEVRDGKPAKVPYRVDGEKAQSNSPATWCQFSTALSAYQDTDAFDGICWMMPIEPGEIVFIDIDNCIKDGVIEPWAQAVVDRFNSYAEKSQSGKGLHILIRGKKPIERCRKHNSPFEIYDHLRPCYLTGDVVEGHNTIVKRQEALDWLFNEIFTEEMRQANEPREETRPGKSSLTDEQVVMKATLAINGQKFKNLFDGVAIGYGGDDSAADIALMNRLAFWCRGDAAQMERIFSSSGLGKRDKWRDRPDYRERTIRKAISGARKFYKPQKVDEQPKGPTVSEDIREQDGFEHLTEGGNAHRLERIHGDDMRFNHTHRKWVVWDGGRWKVDGNGNASRLAEDVVSMLYIAAANATDSKMRDKIAVFAKSTDSRKGIANMLALAANRQRFALIADDFDRDPWLLGAGEVTIDLKTCEAIEPRRSDLITMQAGAVYDNFADCPLWGKFLKDIFAGNDDLINYIKRAVGYCLTGSTSEQVFFFCHGTGANGKSVFLSVLRALMGEYAKQADFNTFLVQRNEKVRNDLAALAGARVITAVEAEEGGRLSMQVLKSWTGGDPITARFLFGENFTFKPQGKIWLAANTKPAITERNHAAWRRVHLIPFNVTIPPEKRDQNLENKLIAELPGIFNWALEGLKDYLKVGLKTPEAVARATAEYRKENDSLESFIAECCELGNLRVCKNSELYPNYVNFCNMSGLTPLSQTKFSPEMNSKPGISSKKSKFGVEWKGIDLKPDWKPQKNEPNPSPASCGPKGDDLDQNAERSLKSSLREGLCAFESNPSPNQATDSGDGLSQPVTQDKTDRSKPSVVGGQKEGGEVDSVNILIDTFKSEDPGFQRFKSGMKKRTCCLCGRSFPYDLTPYFNKGQSGYICATCHMEGPPSEPEKVDSQTKLEAGA